MTRFLLTLLFCLPAVVACGGGTVYDDLEERTTTPDTCGQDRARCQ